MKKNNPPIIQSSISPKPQAISPKPLASSPKPKLFITGITGAIGSYFMDYLINSDFEVYALYNSPQKIKKDWEESSNFHLVRGLLENISDFKDRSVLSIMHISAYENSSNCFPVAKSLKCLSAMPTFKLKNSDIRCPLMHRAESKCLCNSSSSS